MIAQFKIKYPPPKEDVMVRLEGETELIENIILFLKREFSIIEGSKR